MIVVLFTCHKCGLQRTQVPVRERFRSEDIKKWVELVGTECHRRHTSLRPHCPERKLDLAIPTPVNEEDGVGMSASPWPVDPNQLKMLNSKAAN